MIIDNVWYNAAFLKSKTLKDFLKEVEHIKVSNDKKKEMFDLIKGQKKV